MQLVSTPAVAGDVDACFTTAAIVARVCEGQLADFSPAARARARDGLLDYIAVGYAGADDPMVEAMSLALSSGDAGGRPNVIGRARSLAWVDAAAVNGFASHVLDYDDMLSHVRGHPSGPILSAALPLAVARGLNGAALLDAYMLGLDGMSLAGRQLAVALQEAGLHTTVMLGAAGAALACSRLMGLDATAITAAVAIALAQVGGPIANFGTGAKPGQVGLAAAAGGRAALLAEAGLRGTAQPLEDLWQRFGEARYAPTEGAAQPPSVWEADELKFKRYAACSLTHQPIEAARLLRARNGGRIPAKVQVEGSYRIAEMLHFPNPHDRFEVKFSLPYCFAAAYLAEEGSLLAALSPTLPDPRISALAARVHFTVHPDLSDFRAIANEFATVAVDYEGGGHDTERVGGTIALRDRDELLAKTAECLQDASRHASVVDLVDNIEELSTLVPLMSALVRP